MGHPSFESRASKRIIDGLEHLMRLCLGYPFDEYLNFVAPEREHRIRILFLELGKEVGKFVRHVAPGSDEILERIIPLGYLARKSTKGCEILYPHVPDIDKEFYPLLAFYEHKECLARIRPLVIHHQVFHVYAPFVKVTIYPECLLVALLKIAEGGDKIKSAIEGIHVLFHLGGHCGLYPLPSLAHRL